MNIDEIFLALRTGELNTKEAEKKLKNVIKIMQKQKQINKHRSIESDEGKNFTALTLSNPQKSVVEIKEIEKCIVQVTMQDRVNKNTFSRELVQGLKHAFESIEAGKNYKVVILTGYDTYFASGGTKEALLAIQEGRMKFSDNDIYHLPLDCKLPVIAAMQGHGIGAGFSMGLFCDFIVMSRECIYTSNYMKYGFTPGAGATLIFPEKCGISLAQEILFTGKKYRGSELAAKGIPFQVLPRDEVLPFAIKLARNMSDSPRESLVALKDRMAEAIRKKMQSAVEKELEMHEKTFVNQPEVKKRIQVFYDPLVQNEKSNFGGIIAQETKKEQTQDSDFTLKTEIEVQNSLKKQSPRNAIAIIGMSGQFPNAKNLDEFWSNIANGRDCITEIEKSRWPIDRYYDPDPEVSGKTYSKWMGVLENADKFDPLFFNISPAEAELMDPQQRIFLETCWHCIEDAAIRANSLSGSHCSVFVGCAMNEYGAKRLDGQVLMGRAPSMLSARIAYLLNLKGPSLAIDTACSSSLVAIAEACNSLVLKLSDLALAGGVCVLTGPSMHIMCSKAGMLSRDGRCFTFDNRANGFVPGEGVGVILLKRLSDAIRDQDTIYGVIRGWGINQDGKTNGITAPSVMSQMHLEKDVYNRFNINPETISLVEAHGTGTKLGDPIEVDALVESFQAFTPKKNFCALGSVKSNIGHLLTAAGIAGVIKVLLAMKHKMLPPTINYQSLNEHISLDNSPFYINTTLQSWKTTLNSTRCACVSSFGFSGTNAHIVIEEYCPEPAPAQMQISRNSNQPILFVLSAKNYEQLRRYAGSIKHWIESRDDINLTDLAYTLQVGREAMDYRLAFVAYSKEFLQKTLESVANQDSMDGVLTNRAKSQDESADQEIDEADKILLKNIVQEKNLKRAAELWVKGVNINWNDFYGNNKPRRINLPGYPFAKERYWLSENDNSLGLSSITGNDKKKFPSSSQRNTVERRDRVDISMLTPVWDTVSFSKGDLYPKKNQKIVIIEDVQDNSSRIKQIYPTISVLNINSLDNISAIADNLERIGEIHHIFWIAKRNSVKSLGSEDIITAQKQGVMLCFRLIKALLKLGYGTQNLGWTVITVKTQAVHINDSIDPTHAGIHGLIGSMAKEYPDWKIRIVDLEDKRQWPWYEILTLPWNDQGNTWAYRGKEWYRQKLIFVHPDKSRQTLYRKRGVYVVIGGAGGIGVAWSKYMIRIYHAQVVWIGRRQKNAAIEEKMNSLAALGPKPHYIQADATNKTEIYQAYQKIKERFSEINGVIHSAVGVMDKSLAKMEEKLFAAGFSAKAEVSVRIAQVFDKEKLDFVLFFSSLAAFGKTFGQSSYAAGCAFKDAFARSLANQWHCAVKVMNWGYWGYIGIGGKIAETFRNRLTQTGLGNIKSSEAMEALEILLSGPMAQLAFIKTTKPLEMDELDKQEFIKVYPETTPQNIQSIVSQSIAPYRDQQKKTEKSICIKRMEELLCKLLLGQLQAIDAVAEKGQIIKLYDRWMEESFKILAQKNYIKYDEGIGPEINTASIDLAAVWQKWEIEKMSWLQNPDMQGQIVLSEATMKNLPQILTGKTAATDIIFPNASLELVEGIYKNNSISDYFNKVLADSLLAYVMERIKQDTSVRIRIMELGAGTGGTSLAVFNKLKPYQEYIQEYCYTDISKAFLLHAETTFGPWNPYLTYQLFDVEYPVAGQGVSAGKYDIVIAANVLHATRNIRQTLRNIKAVLQNSGIVLLNELSANSLFSHLTFGLLKGWWLYEDPAIRIPGSPILSPEKWEYILHQEGFKSVFFPAAAEQDLGQQIIVSESDGVIRQKNQHENGIKISNKEKLPDKLKNEEIQPGLFREKCTNYLKEVIGKILKIPAHRIDSAEPLEKYGIDSILIGQLNNVLQKSFSDVSSTLLFEYQTIDALVEYFMTNQKESLIRVLGLEKKEVNAKISDNDKMGDKGSSRHKHMPIRKSKRLNQINDQKFSETESAPRKEPIAIIGLSGRYPKAKNVDAFWRNLSEGKDCITEIPKDRWELDGFFHQDKKDAVAKGKSYCKWGGFVEGFAHFDPSFFNMSPADVLNIDPQERLLMESCWEVLEDAGYTREQIEKQHQQRIGVFTGITRTGFDLYGPDLWKYDHSLFPHTSFGSAANRISYIMNLQGPSLPIDTMCASSLTAIHEACEHLYRGECEAAIAGGVNLYLHPSSYIQLCKLHMLSTDGKCKSFGQGSNGFVPGEGVGCLLLKPLSSAMADHDHIYALIRGTSINHGGKTNGYTVPNPKAQRAVIRTALEKAGVNARAVSYIEAHGTGTELGDPIEITGLLQAFEKDTQDTGFCAIGSVKSNIGHLEAAAGIAGVTKVILQMKNQKIAPSLHAKDMNPNINFAKTPFKIQQELAAWKRPLIAVNGEMREYPRIAGISSFGAGGSNAHIVIEEYVPYEMEAPLKIINREYPAIIVLSAKNEKQLIEQVERLLAYVREQELSESDLTNMAYTLQIGREAMEERLAVIVGSIKALEEKLSGFLAGQADINGLFRGQAKRNKETLGILKADEEFQEAIHKWLQRGKYAKLIELWVSGLSFDWNKLYNGTRPHRISLPTYPFDKERYWFPSLEPNMQDAAGSDSKEPFTLMTFAEEWQEQALPNTAPIQLNTIICFVTNPENQKEISATVKDLGQKTKIIFIAQGTTCQKRSSQQYSISQNERHAYEKSFRSIRKEHGEIDAILYLWALEDPGRIGDYTDIVYILQAMASTKLKSKKLLLFAQFASGLERCYIESWIGFERSLRLVLPSTQMAVVYQAACESEPERKIEKWLRKCYAELQAEKSQSAFYQGKRRYVNKVRPTELKPGKSLLRPGGTYLITGGCGGLGQIFAEYFARKHSVNLVLTGRSVIDEEKRNKIKVLEDMGSRVVYIQADVCDLSRMQEGLKRAKMDLGEINGAIHAAGVQDNQHIDKKDIKEFTRILDPKINGILMLDKLLQSEPLDFICYFSSSSAILGDSGSCDYAIGNRFLMAYAQYRNSGVHQNQKPGKAFVINWPLWRNGGMRIDNDQAAMYLKASGQRFLETQEGVSMFDRILAQNDAQHLVVAGQSSRVERFLGLGKERPAMAFSVPSLSGNKNQEKIKGLSLRQCIEWDLKDHVVNLLKISRDKLDRETNLVDFGFDSIGLTQFAEVLNSFYEIEITPALFFGHSNLEKLTQYFLEEHIDKMQRFYQEKTTAPAAPLNCNAVAMPSRRPISEKSRFVVNKVASNVPEPIAVIGMSGRFPKAGNIDDMWKILEKGENVIEAFIDDRYSGKRFGKTKYKCGYIQGVSEFDPMFFEISPREAMCMDPRQRLLLQETWKALEDAGYGTTQIKNKIGMFVGAEEGEYGKLVKEKGSVTSNSSALLAARLAYFLNLSGPVMTINTTCSSGLVAVHQACLSLRNRECDTAIAAGVALMLTSEIFDGMDQAGMLSENGTCFAFDKRANGMVPAEAVAAVVLKRLSQAQADGDPIYAIIRASGMNYDGKTNGITAPSWVSQTELLKSVYEQNKINPAKIEYIVTHGTGTKLGDSVEIKALCDVFKKYSEKNGYCALTSAKTNFGHALAASGLVSLVCLIQAFQHEIIPASLNCEQENEYIHWEKSPFYVNKTSKHWPIKNDKGRLGAISAFGMSGTNVHMVLQHYHSDKASLTQEPVPYYLIPLSAKTENALQEKISDIMIELKSKRLKEEDLPRISYTLIEGRQHFDHRFAMVIHDLQEAAYVLKSYENGKKIPNLFNGKVSRNFSGERETEEYGNELLSQCQSIGKNTDRFKENLYAVADLYCQGYKLCWNLLFTKHKPQRIHLPAYPFAKDRYWVTDLDHKRADDKTEKKVIPLAIQPPKLKSASEIGAQPCIPIASSHKADKIRLRPLSDGQMPQSITNKEPANAEMMDPQLLIHDQTVSEAFKEELAESLAEILYLKRSDVDMDNKFMDMGVDSIIGVEWIKALNNRYGASITATKIYDYPTIHEFAGFMEKELKRQKGDSIPKASNRLCMQAENNPGLSTPKKNNRHLNTALNEIADETSIVLNDSATKNLKPENLGNVIFQERYRCKWNYFAGSMYRGISSEQFVIAMGQFNLLSFFGSAGFSAEELEPRIQSIQSKLGPDKPYGMCLIYNLNHPEDEMRQVDLFIKYKIPVIEAAAYYELSLPLVYLRVKGICKQADKIILPRRIVAKCSRLEVARLFLSPPPIAMVNDLLKSGLINEEEVKLSQAIPMADDLAVEADSGGHTDQGVSFVLIPAIIALKDEMKGKYHYQEDILIGCGGGIGNPEAVVSAFMLGADFIFTGSINQCSVESGVPDVVKDILNSISIHDTAVTIAGDMFEVGAKVQVVKKYTQFHVRANRLYQLFMQYNSLDKIPQEVKHEIETKYFKKTFEQVWEQICEYKNKKNAEQIKEAKNNPRLRMTLVFKWYFAHCSQVTLSGDENEKDNFQIFCGPALGSFNQWVKGTQYAHWKNRHVDKIAELLMHNACEDIQKKLFSINVAPQPEQTVVDNPIKQIAATPKKDILLDDDYSIAIIGMSGQFPKANTLYEFWDNLSNGKNCISEIPASRWSKEEYYHTDPMAAGKTNCKWMGVLEDADKFDPLFFNISPSEAELMDPQQRLFLENCWHCIEDAGLRPAVLSGSRCGVFVGCGTSTYGQSISDRDLSAQNLMGGATSILSARISYLLNLKGPCLAIETACSSSLVAIAEACNSLILRNSDLALAGGVNVQHGPAMHIMTSKAGMLSKDGRCFSFDNRANGFVPGEGVGVILLKRLCDAVCDQDTIYGVIRGWGINQDGKTNGITSPSANSQIQLEKDVYARFHIDPATISLVEAHGTGTKLGDPIEVEALTKAFRAFTEKKNYCALGSVKSNIGHLLTAAGVSGVIKVLLALKHKMLPPTINFETLNEHISLSNSPFYINTKLKPWENGHGAPRRACVSSFGFSGTNAHLVIEEYLLKTDPRPSTNIIALKKPALFILSAKSAVQLKIYANQIKDWIETQKVCNLADVAYTLQTGREAMDYRLAFLADSREFLRDALEGFVAGHAAAGLLTAHVKSKESVPVFETDEDAKVLLQTWIEKGKLHEIAKLWVKGLNIDWAGLYVGTKPRRISLPTYPFARERYWLPEAMDKSAGSTTASAWADTIHPLLQENTSNLTEQRFSSVFTGQEFFLSDHIIKGRKVLPAVAYLEMIRMAAEQAAEVLPEDERRIRISNIVWSRPVVVDHHPVRIHIGLYPANDQQIGYAIYSHLEGVEEDPVIHSQGNTTRCRIAAIPAVDIAAIKSECIRKSLSASQCYKAFQLMGIDYGPGHRGIEALYVGTDKVLAKLRLPGSVAGTQNQFVLHPSLMDSALQASIGFMPIFDGDLSNQAALKPVLPFALQAMDIHAKCQASMWAVIRSRDNDKAADQYKKLDIDLCDEQGNVCVRMKGFSCRVLEGEVDPEETNASLETLILRPIWKEKTVDGQATVFGYMQHLVILCEPEKISRETIESQISGVTCLALQSLQKDIGERFLTYAGQVLTEIKKILKQKPKNDILIQIVVSDQKQKRLLVGLSGLLKTAQLENPKITGQLIEIEPEENKKVIIEKLVDNSHSPMDNQIRYINGKRCVAGWRELEGYQNKEKIPWKDKGVYLITGGAGGLGMIFAKEIVQKVQCATLILAGRSILDEDRKFQLKQLEIRGARIEYKRLDVTKKQAVADLIRNIKEDFRHLDGIMHCAGVIRDNFIIKKTEEEFQKVLAPKVTGLVNLDQASRDLRLDFFILFSSGAGDNGNIGQADYAAANAFMDAYARYRNSLVTAAQRFGHTLSINWPLWQDGGMRIDAETVKMIRQSTGVAPLQTSTGIRALYQGLASGQDQVLVLEGEAGRMKAVLLDQTAGIEVAKSTAISRKNNVVSVIEQDLLKEKAINYFKRLLSTVIKLPAHRIEADAPLEKYGIDSIMVIKLTDQLEKTFGSLSKTLFFEYQDIEELTAYFLEAHRDQLMELLGLEAEAGANVPHIEDAANVAESKKTGMGNRARRPFMPFQVENLAEKESGALNIAIIGIAGRYPRAGNVQEFWQNLRYGKDCITEIPQDRWDHRLYFDKDKNKFGKTYSKWGGFLEGVDQFDPLFFNISMREAEMMDPQERLFLQCVYETIEDAGYTREGLSTYQADGLEGNVGVFVGVMYDEYQLWGMREQTQGTTIALVGDSASIANRVSYFFNFHGPSMAINTMCSSSITAIHLACQNIRHGECDLAIAGGVNLSIHPNKYLALGQGRFLSSNGKCTSFGEGGDGYVPGEAVGAVLLKPLSLAISDRDHIYGIIKATAINHGGKTNGYSVPNPNAQASVIGRALKKAEIDPRAISYIEAHGTGTNLGDPIEITGLTKIFGEYCNDRQFCTIGSAKSNIGHCESAAGIAGVTKVVLQLKHGQLAPSLHSARLNPNIDFKNTPFTVQQELTEWKRPVITNNGETRQYPRIAGISSFGAGGANAHVIIEEYHFRKSKAEQITIRTQNPAMVILSAKNEERLKEQARQLLTAIKAQQMDDITLAGMAYTLQVGREAMEERLALVVSSIKELEEKLESFTAGQEQVEDLYRGQVEGNRETLAVLAADEDMAKTIDAWITKRKYSKLLDLWVKGLHVDWNRFYDTKPGRVSLPTYPFAREHYWIPKIETKAVSGNADADAAMTAPIHPLLQQNTSCFSEQRYSATFTGQEFFLHDHVVGGRRILPAVVFLEMARAGAEHAAGASDRLMGMQFKNVVWTQPVTVGEQAVQVHIGLFPEDNGDIGYKVYSEPGQVGDASVVHSQGTMMLNTIGKAQPLDIKALQDECSQNVISSGQCYALFKEIGITYGPTHQAIEKLYAGKAQVLAKLLLPVEVGETQDQFVLHPSLMDSALQASIGLVMNLDSYSDSSKASMKAMLPFALQALEVLNPCTPSMWAVARFSEGGPAKNHVQKLDIDLCDGQGNLCVRMRGLALAGQIDPTGISEDRALLLEPQWRREINAQNATEEDEVRHIIMLCGMGDVSAEVKRRMKKTRCINLESNRKGIIEGFQDCAARVLQEIQGLYNDKVKGNILLQLVVPNQGDGQLFAAIGGILKTARLENPRFFGQLIEVSPSEGSKKICEKLKANSCSPLQFHIRHKNGVRSVAGWKEVESCQEPVQIPWQDQGIYLITGGAGDLGLIFAEEIARKTAAATLVLAGRSSIGQDKQAKLKHLEVLGARVEYQQVDVTQEKAAEELIRSMRQAYGKINGILHGAGVIHDNFILNKTPQELQKVFAPKVAGLVNLDRASKSIDLDFFILFSSVAGAFGNIGQADYSAANAFMDAYANYRNASVASRQRHGLTLSMNWPLWKEGGMHVDAEAEKIFRQKMGLVAMQTKTGMNALYQSLALGKEQVMVLTGDIKRIRTQMLSRSIASESIAGPPKAVPETGRNLLREKATDHFKALISQVTKVPVHRIKTDGLLLNYGIDSILMMKITDQLEKIFGPLSKTLLLEYQNINALIGYFIEFHCDRLAEMLESNQKDIDGIAEKKAQPVKTTIDSGLRKFYALKKENNKQAEKGADEHYRIERFPNYMELSNQVEIFNQLQIQNPYFRSNESVISNNTWIDGREYISYSSYNYLGFSGDKRVTRAANEAADRYGTSVSASRAVTGEKPIHGELERELAIILGTESCIVFNSGHPTNVSTISCLLGSKDLVIYDELGHNSIVQGAILSGARRIIFPHNNWKALAEILKQDRMNYERTLIIVEGVYSMDGDIAELPKFVELKKRYKALLMVDEAHSIGVLGKNGRGIGEHFGIDPQDVDVWMGTLSKTFASCGGYIAGSNALIQLLKYSAGGFVYSVGMPPANAGAALAAARLLRTETERVAKLKENSRFFLELAKEKGLDTGLSKDSAIIPIIIRDPEKTFKLADKLFQHGINVHPICYPAVARGEDRLRFFITSLHTKDQMLFTTSKIRESLNHDVRETK